MEVGQIAFLDGHCAAVVSMAVVVLQLRKFFEALFTQG